MNNEIYIYIYICKATPALREYVYNAKQNNS